MSRRRDVACSRHRMSTEDGKTLIEHFRTSQLLVRFVDFRCNKRVENSKDSVLLRANLQLLELTPLSSASSVVLSSLIPRSPRLWQCAQPLELLRRSPHTPTLLVLHSQGGAVVSSTNCPLGLSRGATGVPLDQLGDTAAPPATCGSAYARCDWGRAS